MTDPSNATVRRRGLPPGRLLFGVLAGLALSFGFSTGALTAYQGEFSERVHPGVTVAGVDISGLSREAAAQKLERELAGYAEGAVTLDVGGERVQLPYATLGRRADVATLIELAWSVGRSASGPLERAVGMVRGVLTGTAIEPLLVVDAEAVAREVERVAALVDRPAVDGTAAATELGFETTPAVAGRGLPREEVARALLQHLVDPAAPAALVLSFDLAPVEPAVTDEDVTAAFLAATRMARTVQLIHGEENWEIGAATVRSWIEFGVSPSGVYAPVVTEADPVDELANIAAAIDREPTDASFLVGRGEVVVGVVAASDGRKLDVDAAASLVASAVNARATTVTTIPPPAVDLPVRVVEPNLTTEQAEEIAPQMRRLSRWTTYYEVSERNGFGSNITIPTLDIDGYVLEPGAEFDFWDALGPITYERGYRYGGVILDGRSEPTGAFAGGICATSTTLFVAAVRAGLPILERDNHFYYIARYPMGLDATVWKSAWSEQSMRFRNDTPHPILIRGLARPGVVTFEIWGPPTGRTVVISPPTVRDVVRARDTEQFTTSLRPGERQRIEFPVDGMQVWVSRTVHDAAGALLHEDTWFSDYRRVNGIVLVGMDPAAPDPIPTPDPAPTPQA
jgi:vancomycin resistance protein YoaR